MMLPTPPQPHYAWTIATSRDLLDKAIRERDRFRRSHEANDGEQVDHAMNCAITLWHIRDWLWYERIAAWQAQGIKNREAFRQWLKARDGRNRLTLCQRLADGSKHFVLRASSPVDASTYVSESDIPDSQDRKISGRLAGGERLVAWSLSITDARDVLKFSTTDGDNIRADNLFEAVINFRKDLFQEIASNQ